MKKSVIFLINGLGIEKPGSYSISIDQCMPQLARTKETAFYTSAIINSIEFRSAYEQFYLGDTYRKEIQYIREHVLEANLEENPVFQNLKNHMVNSNCKLHIFLEPTNDKIIEEINELVNHFPIDEKREIYLHLLLSQQTVNEYNKLINMVNFIKYHSNTRITVGFVIGKESLPDVLGKEDNDIARNLFFYCSAERWTETDKKLESLRDANVRPCMAPGFCATNSCTIQNGDAILFFNTRRTDYDKFLHVIYDNAASVFRTTEFSLPVYSMIQLDTKFDVACFLDHIVYDNSLVELMKKANKKSLIITAEKNISLVNFLANGLNYVNSPQVQFMKLDENFLSLKENIVQIIDNSEYDLIIFDYHMDVSKTINDLKEQLERMDVVLGYIADVCVNKHSLFITSLYGLKKELPIAPYNTEMVMIDYEMEIPIFFFDYSYPRSKYALYPGETNMILTSAISCIWENTELESLIRQKGLINNLMGILKK